MRAASSIWLTNLELVLLRLRQGLSPLLQLHAHLLSPLRSRLTAQQR